MVSVVVRPASPNPGLTAESRNRGSTEHPGSNHSAPEGPCRSLSDRGRRIIAPIKFVMRVSSPLAAALNGHPSVQNQGPRGTLPLGISASEVFVPGSSDAHLLAAMKLKASGRAVGWLVSSLLEVLELGLGWAGVGEVPRRSL